MHHALPIPTPNRTAHWCSIHLLLLCLPVVAAAQEEPQVTRPARQFVWTTPHVGITGMDDEALIEHGSHRASRVERRMVLRNISNDEIQLNILGSCGCDYYGATKSVLAPGDTTEMYVGYDLRSVTGPWSKVVTLVIRSRTAAGEPWLSVARYPISSRGVRIVDVRFQAGYAFTLDGAAGRTIDTAVAIICTAPKPIDVRARFEALAAHIMGQLDTALHHMLPGDTLRLPLRITLANSIGSEDRPTATIRTETTHTRDGASMYILLMVRE